MKKILSLLSFIGLAIIPTMGIVACGNNEIENSLSNQKFFNINGDEYAFKILIIKGTKYSELKNFFSNNLWTKLIELSSQLKSLRNNFNSDLLTRVLFGYWNSADEIFDFPYVDMLDDVELASIEIFSNDNVISYTYDNKHYKLEYFVEITESTILPNFKIIPFNR